ncbi:MAG: hypothetical protein GF405_07635 [Candidatus Eisenbacteria bacterium]|nr:hypothetical protein [Candidatus Eisenbacteria bacterium]
MYRRPGQPFWSSATSLILLAAVLAVVGLLSREWFVRADLTERNDFTVSTSTRELLRGLDDVVTVTVYMSDRLPTHMTGFRTRIEDTLSEYRAYGGDMIVVRYVDPSGNPEAEEEALSHGIRPVQLQAVEQDRAEVVSTYMGLTVSYGGRVESIPLLLVPEQLEYELSSTILKITVDSLPVVGFLTGHGAHSPDGVYSLAAESLERNYEVREVDLRDGDEALEGVDVLVVAGADDVPDPELFVLDQYIMRGGRALFLLNAVAIPRDAATGTVATGNIYDYVSRYGADVQHELVVDRVNENAAFRSGFMTMTTPYPFWPKAVAPNISTEHPVVSELDAIAFPWTSPITPSRGKTDSVRYEVLARSSGRSWTAPPTLGLDPRAPVEPPPEKAKAIEAGRAAGHDLMVALTGRFESAFLNMPVLVTTESGAPRPTYPEGRLDGSRPTQMIVVGNARMFADDFYTRSPTSPILFLNAVDWLTHGRRLIDVRSKAIDDRPLPEISENGRLASRALGTFAVPLAVALFGIWRAWARGRRTGRPHGRDPS